MRCLRPRGSAATRSTNRGTSRIPKGEFWHELPAKIRRKRASILVLAFLSCFVPLSSSVAGPIFITRGLLIHPVYGEYPADSGGFLAHIGMWGGVQKGLGSEGDRFGWLLDVGAAIELWRWERSSLLAISGMQLSADPHNEISFNPTGVTWEEHLVYASHGESFDWQLGFAQRCRHDVDNLDIKESTGQPQQRTLIYSSITGRLIGHDITLRSLKLKWWVNGDAYVIAQDYRLPTSTRNELPNIERLAWSVTPNAQIDGRVFNNAKWYVNAGATISRFGNESGFFKKFFVAERTHFDTRVEAGLAIPGRAGKLSIFAGFESLSDDGIMPVPESNHFAFLGFRIVGLDLLY